MSKLKLAVLISGRGSNLQALIDACANPSFPAEIAVVVSNIPHAAGLERAAAARIPAMICDHTYFKGDKPGFENALATILEQHGTELVCLAGFMRIISSVFLNRFKDKVINIHPSLLPAYKGLDTHARALAAGETTHGCSVHVVTAGMDEGPVIAQRAVAILPDDTVETLTERVLVQEHILYPDVVADIATGAVVIRQGQIERAAGLLHHGNTEIESFLIPESPVDQHHDSRPSAPDYAFEDPRVMWDAFAKAFFMAGGLIATVLALLAIFLV